MLGGLSAWEWAAVAFSILPIPAAIWWRWHRARREIKRAERLREQMMDRSRFAGFVRNPKSRRVEILEKPKEGD